MKNKRRPNLFIIGGPHSGTTSLYHYLENHPDICMSKTKEPNCYLFSDYNPYIKNLKDYLAQWSPEKGKKILGEATPTYIYSKKAAKNIHKFNPKAKIIMILRDPNQALISWFSSVFIERVGISEPHFEIFNHEKNVPRFTKTFPKKQILIIDFNEFVRETPKMYRRVLKFLEVQDDGKKEFPNYKQGYEIRSHLFNKFIHKYFHGENKLKSFAKILISNKTAQKIADLNKIKIRNKKKSRYGPGGFKISKFSK